MAADENCCEKLEFQNNWDKEENQENDFGSLKAAKKRKTDRNLVMKRKSLDELSVTSTLSRLRRGFTSRRLSLRRSSIGKSSPAMRRLSSAQAGPRGRTLSSLHGSLKRKLKKSLRLSSRSGMLDYSANLRSTPRRMQYLQLLSALHRTSGQDGNDDPLWQKIEHEIRMKEGAAKLLAVNRNPGIALEASKSLLSSTARLNAYMIELEAHKALGVTEGALDSNEELKPCRATVTVSDLRIPLVWKDLDHFLNKNDRHYAAFCLFHLGSTVCDTSLLFDIDRKTTELSFDDVITFEATDNKFEVHLEVYLHRICHDDLRLAFTPLKNRKRLSDISTSVGIRLSGIAEEVVDQTDVLIGPRFDCIARATLSMKDADGCIGCYDLVLDPLIHDGSSGAIGLTLFGNFCCRLSVQPSSLTDRFKSGWLSVRSQSESEWKEFWCRLECSELLGWSQMSAVNTSAPALRVSLDQETEIQRNSFSDEGENSGRFIITTRLAADRILRYEITSDDAEYLSDWKKALLQRICDFREWKDACRSMADVPATPFKFKTLGRSFSVKKNESLARAADADSPMTRILTRLNINALPSDTSDRSQTSSAHCSVTTESSVFV